MAMLSRPEANADDPVTPDGPGAGVAKRHFRLWPFVLLGPAVVYSLLLIVVPNLTMLRMSFHERSGMRTHDEGTFTIGQYVAVLTSGYHLDAIFKTIGYSLVVVAMSLMLGYPLAYMIARTRSRWRPLILAMVITPFTVSLVVSAYGWLVLLGYTGPISWLATSLGLSDQPIGWSNTPTGAIIAMSVNFIPFQVLPLISAIRNIEPDLEDASANLGATPLRTFLRVTLPLSLPGILGGASLVMMLGLTAFVAPRMIGGASMPMLGKEVYNSTIIYLNWPQAAAIAAILTAITLTIYLAMGRLLASRHLAEGAA